MPKRMSQSNRTSDEATKPRRPEVAAPEDSGTEAETPAHA